MILGITLGTYQFRGWAWALRARCYRSRRTLVRLVRLTCRLQHASFPSRVLPDTPVCCLQLRLMVPHSTVVPLHSTCCCTWGRLAGLHSTCGAASCGRGRLAGLPHPFKAGRRSSELALMDKLHVVLDSINVKKTHFMTKRKRAPKKRVLPVNLAQQACWPRPVSVAH